MKITTLMFCQESWIRVSILILMSTASIAFLATGQSRLSFYTIIFPLVFILPGVIADYVVWRSYWPEQQVRDIREEDGAGCTEDDPKHTFVYLEGDTKKDLSDYRMEDGEIAIGDYVAKDPQSFRLRVRKVEKPPSPRSISGVPQTEPS